MVIICLFESIVASKLILSPSSSESFNVIKLSTLESVKAVLFVFRIASLKVSVILELTATPVSEFDGLSVKVGATINSNKTKITIDLVNDLTSEQTVYVAIGPTVEDSYDNALGAIHYGIFTAADKLPPTVEIEAVITASIATNSNITFTFSEAIRNLDNSAITDSNVGSLMTLKDTDANGADIPFVATINSAKTIITIDPVSNFTSMQKIYAAIGATVEDFDNNVIPASSKTFTAEYLKEELQNPFNEKDVIALIDGQRETSKRFIEQSSYAVLNRMEWLRRNRDINNLSDQGVKFVFNHEKYQKLLLQ